MTLFYLHVGFMLTAFGAVLAGITIARSLRKQGWWLMAHRRTAYAGVAAMAAGLLAAVAMISFSGGEHFETPHTWVGGLTFLSAGTTLAFGLSLFRFPGHGARLRPFHRRLGRFTAIAAAVTVFSGLYLVLL